MAGAGQADDGPALFIDSVLGGVPLIRDGSVGCQQSVFLVYRVAHQATWSRASGRGMSGSHWNPPILFHQSCVNPAVGHRALTPIFL